MWKDKRKLLTVLCFLSSAIFINLTEKLKRRDKHFENSLHSTNISLHVNICNIFNLAFHQYFSLPTVSKYMLWANVFPFIKFLKYGVFQDCTRHTQESRVPKATPRTCTYSVNLHGQIQIPVVCTIISR